MKLHLSISGIMAVPINSNNDQYKESTAETALERTQLKRATAAHQVGLR